jgi:hypothetical protein
MRNRPVVLISLAALVTGSALAQQHHASARDAFWSASDLFAVSPNPAKHTGSKPKVSTPKATSQGANTAGSQAMVDPGTANPRTASHAESAVQLVAENGYGAAPHLVRTSESRLGLRYSVLLLGSDGQYAEVGPGTIFHSGDHIRLSLMANEPGYLYVIQQGSSGAWSPIFPKAGSPPDASKIQQGVLQEIPSGTRSFQFDEHPGEEKLFVILSKTPITDLEKRVQTLKGGEPVKSDQPAMPDAGQTLEAQNHIPDIFVQQMASRDLMLVDEEKVDQAPTASHGGEKAVYVVSKMDSAQGNGSEVVASIKLEHQ